MEFTACWADARGSAVINLPYVTNIASFWGRHSYWRHAWNI